MIVNIAIILLLFNMAIAFLTAMNSSVATPPAAKIVPKNVHLHAEVLVDNYAWLRDRSDPDVVKHLEAENAYTDHIMAETVQLREKLYQEIVSRIKETDVEAPYPQGGYYYYTRTEEGKQYPIYCRKKGSLDAPEEIILDQNEIAKDYKYLRLGALAVSPDQHLLAYSLDTTGSEAFALFIKDLRSAELLSDRIDDVVSIVWAMDNSTIFYTTRDEARRPYRLFRHLLGANPTEDQLVYEESDERFYLGASRTRSNAYIFIQSGSFISTEVRFIKADEPQSAPTLILPREADHEYFLDHWGEEFYIITNRGAKNFRLVAAPISDPRERNWREVLPHRPDVMLEDVEFFVSHFVALERERGLQRMRVTDLRTGEFHYIEFPEPAYSAVADVNRVFETNRFRFLYTSFITPMSIYEYNLETRERVLLKQQEVLGGYDPSQYQSERIEATAPDGKEIPISLVYRKSTKRDGGAPLHLTGYGAYGMSYPVMFASTRLSLLDRGITFAVAHVRGGADLGKEWHDDGKMLKKKNTFTDFIASAEYLINQGYTTPDRLTIEGGSAGGLLMGAVVNMRPELFKAVVAQVPFVDVLNTMLDASLPLTVGEYLEWGNPNEKEYFDYIKSYCPYTNVTRQAYPNMLVRVGFNDPRVGYWEGAKWVAKLRTHKTNDAIILLKADMATGHAGASGRYDRLREIAFDYAYLLSQYGITE